VKTKREQSDGQLSIHSQADTQLVAASIPFSFIGMQVDGTFIRPLHKYTHDKFTTMMDREAFHHRTTIAI